MGRSKLSAIVLVMVSFGCFYVVHSAIETFVVLERRWEEFNNNRIELIPPYLDLGAGFLKQNDLEQAALYAEKAIDENLVDFYYLTKNGELEYSYAKKVKNFIKIQEKSIGNLLISDEYSYASTQVGNTVLTIGVVHTRFEHYAHFIMENSSSRLRVFIIFLLGGLLIMLYYFKDIFSALKFLGSNDPKDLSQIKSRSKEGEALISSLNAYNHKMQSLEEENLKLGDQILPALRAEIDSDKKPPYDFYCTLVRTDINNFTHIFSNYPVKEFMEIINEFFTDLTAIASHYDGVISEFIGDEAIYYFKDDKHQNSQAAAISAVRDIHELASRFNKKTLKENGYPFVVKSALAHGPLHFGKQVNGFSLSGGILIETVRILSHIKEKNENSVYYKKDFSNSIEFLCDSQKGETVSLKGLPEPVQLYSYKKHKTLSHWLNPLDDKTAKPLTYYRNLSSLIKVFETLRSQDVNPSVYAQTLLVLEDAKIYSDDIKLAENYKKTLTLLHSHWQKTDEDSFIFLLSQGIQLSKTLFDLRVFKEEIAPLFKTYMNENKNPRLVANIIGVYQYFDLPFEKSHEAKLLCHPNNRVKAQILIKAGRKRLTKSIVKHLSKMLADKRKAFVLSGLFAVGELASYYKKEDLVFFKTSRSLKNLIKTTKKYQDDNDKKIRNQALNSAKKIKDAA